MTLATSCDSYSGAGLVALKLYILKKCVTCCVIVLSCDISSMSLFQTVYYYLNISHPLIYFLISLIHLGVLGYCTENIRCVNNERFCSCSIEDQGSLSEEERDLIKEMHEFFKIVHYLALERTVSIRYIQMTL